MTNPQNSADRPQIQPETSDEQQLALLAARVRPEFAKEILSQLASTQKAVAEVTAQPRNVEATIDALSFDDLLGMKKMESRIARWTNIPGVGEVLTALNGHWLAELSRRDDGQWQYRIASWIDPRHSDSRPESIAQSLHDNLGILSKPFKSKEAARLACTKQLMKGIGYGGKERLIFKE